MRTAFKVAIAATALGAVAAAGYGVPRYLQQRADARDTERFRSQVTYLLRDPSSAQFRNEKLVRNAAGSALCGYVNGRNAFGGYVGFRQFVATGSATLIAPAARGNSVDELKAELAYIQTLKSRCFTDAEIATGQALARSNL